MAMQARPLTPLFGLEVTGIDLTAGIDAPVRHELYRMFADNAVLVLRDQQFDAPQFAAAARLFGEIIPEQFPHYRLPEFPTVSFLSNRDLEQTGKQRAVRGEGFHTDHSNYAAPPKATILYGITIPSSGGDTEFASVQAAYDDLPEAEKRRIAGLKAIHSYAGLKQDHKATVLSAEQLAGTPVAKHPLVRLNPDNGRRGIFISPNRVSGIEGMADEDALALLDALYAHATQPRYLYRHKWRKGDMVIWDNRSVLHQATTDYDMEEYRYLYRVLLAGQTPVEGGDRNEHAFPPSLAGGGVKPVS